jgi:hypothetical protein
VPPRPGTPPAAPDGSERSQYAEIEGAPPEYVHIHSPLPNAQFFNLDIYTKNCKHNKVSIPDLLTDRGPYTG